MANTYTQIYLQLVFSLQGHGKYYTQKAQGGTSEIYYRHCAETQSQITGNKLYARPYACFYWI